MVFLTKIFLAAKHVNKHNKKSRSFLDSLRLYVRGGSGGNGLPKYGGIGGKGGDIYLTAKSGIKLKDVVQLHPTKRIIAGHGGHSEKNKLLGELGKDIKINVPVGVSVFNEYGLLLGELNVENDEVLVGRGGPGGNALTQFIGHRGEAGIITLDLKLIADIGLVGFPNAGKSSLLKAISRARPKIASYPFTTIEPNIGIMVYDDHRQITMADLPGLIEGAHANLGLGHKFLKHVERTKLILLVVDINGFRLSPHHQHRSALETVLLLNKEIELYQKDLLRKPILLAVNKMDTISAQAKWDELKLKLMSFQEVVNDFPEELRPEVPIQFQNIFQISALSCSKSVLLMKEELRKILDLEAEKETENEEFNLREILKLKMSESGVNVI